MSGIDRSKLLRRLCPGDQFQGWQQALDLERIPGPSATGKTLLSSCLVYHIRTNRGTVGHAAVACVYFQERHKQYDVADFNHAFASVLRQLVSQLPDTSDTLRKLELAEYDKIPRLWGDECTRLLHRITGELGKVLIILDGVAADVTTKALTYLILAINPDGGSDQIIQVLFTSQAPPPIGFSILHQIVKTQICAYDADVKKFIIKALQSISGKDLSSSHSEFVKSLVRTFDGCFLPVPTWPSEMPMPELLAAIDQITSACKDISIHDKADAFSKESFPENQGFSFLLGNGAEISELNEGILKQCRQENPDVAVYLQELGIDVLAADESEAED
ncbi:uncharacterized protein FRV6_11628 [Fusarium oxysporum]|uniref:Nephrocystin 3-like N-terminal domain-containing protein n=1 Tax=Fusarium oxysporum TaxID=5507 RepID=A0A2H3TP72_FUSOX|nr:uncharacterized protein FRV6_11628 [Fusarium oxysporum]